MSKKEKLISKLQSRPRDFNYSQTKALLEMCGYTMLSSGKTGGSRVAFVRGQKVFRMHKPHPNKELHAYQVKELIDELSQEGLL